MHIAEHNVAMKLFAFRKRVTREDVRWCYHHILKREPESEDAITAHLVHKEFRCLAESFAQSAEASRLRESDIDKQLRQRQIQQVVHVDAPIVAGAPAANRIDSAGSQAEIALCITHTQTAMTKKNLSGTLLSQLNTSTDKASTSDAPDCGAILASFHHHGVPAPLSGKLLLLGRNSTPLALSLAKHVATVDVLELEKNSPNEPNTSDALRNTLNVSLTVCDIASLKSLPLSDFCYSESTLHFCPPPLSAALIRSGVRALRPGGVAIFQIITQIDGYNFDLVTWLAQRQYLTTMEHALPEIRIREIAAGQGCDVLNAYDDAERTTSSQRSRFFVLQKRGSR
jgi:SAM-dependent methyltransferase